MTELPNQKAFDANRSLFDANSSTFDSDFPSLSGAPQPQQPNTSAQAIWSNPNLRQQTPIQRTPGQSVGSQGPTQPPQQGQHQQPHEDGTSGSHFSGNVDDYRFGGQGGVGQLSGTSQPQTGNIDEFPPLGGAGDGGQDRRTSLIQNAAYSSNVNGNAFGGVGQGRNGLLDGQVDRGITRLVSHTVAGSATDQGFPFRISWCQSLRHGTKCTFLNKPHCSVANIDLASKKYSLSRPTVRYVTFSPHSRSMICDAHVSKGKLINLTTLITEVHRRQINPDQIAEDSPK